MTRLIPLIQPNEAHEASVSRKTTDALIMAPGFLCRILTMAAFFPPAHLGDPTGRDNETNPGVEAPALT